MIRVITCHLCINHIIVEHAPGATCPYCQYRLGRLPHECAGGWVIWLDAGAACERCGLKQEE